MRVRLRIIFITFLILLSQLVNAIDLENGVIFDMPEEQVIKQFGRVPGYGLKSNQIKNMLESKFEGDTVKILAILVEWTNRPGTYSRETFDSLMFSRDVYPGGSVADYYNEVSYGKTTVVGDVIDWYNAGYYEGSFDFESILPDINQLVDFSQYDGDYDGNVDAVVFIRSETGMEETGNPDDIWSYAYSYDLGSGPGPYDGVRIPRWNTSPELRPLRFPPIPTLFTGLDSLNRIRVFTHEIGHSLGLNDLYDYDDKLVTSTYYTENDYNDHPLVDWCVMGYAGYGIFSLISKVPSHFCGWSKMQMDWVEPVELIGEHTDLVIYDIETHDENSLFKIPINPYEGEYFLLEYRNPHSTGIFDKIDSDFSAYFFPDLSFGGDTLDQGLLITHIIDSIIVMGWFNSWRINDGTPLYSDYMVKVVDAGYSTVKDTSFNPDGKVSDSAQWWYPYETRKAATFSSEVEGQEEMSPNTIPSSDGFHGPTGIIVRVDSIVNEKLYAYVYNPIDTDYDSDGYDAVDDNCPLISNSDQADADSDGIGDVCDKCTDSDNDSYGDAGYALNECEVDNCPDAYNPDQADTDNDGIGDACCCEGFRGNFDNDVNDVTDIDDLIYMVEFQFSAGSIILCPDEGDIFPISNPNGAIDIDDLIAMVAYQFADGLAPGLCVNSK